MHARMFKVKRGAFYFSGNANNSYAAIAASIIQRALYDVSLAVNGSAAQEETHHLLT